MPDINKKANPNILQRWGKQGLAVQAGAKRRSNVNFNIRRDPAGVTVNRLLAEFKKQAENQGRPELAEKLWMNFFGMNPEGVRGFLHMFFSPFVVPEGLTAVEVKFCVAERLMREAVWQLAKTKVGYKAFNIPFPKKGMSRSQHRTYERAFKKHWYGARAGLTQQELPDELLGLRGKKMRRTDFAKGVVRLLNHPKLAQLCALKGS